MRVGDLVFTNFFGEAHKVCLLLEIKKPVVYGRWDRVDPCLVLLPDGRKVWLQRGAILTVDEYEGG